MLTTAGSSVLAICENWFDSWRGAGTLSGVASADLFSCPRTPPETTVPIKMPSASVSRMISVDAGQLALKRAHKVLARSYIFKIASDYKLLIIPSLQDDKARIAHALLLDAEAAESVVESCSISLINHPRVSQ